MRRLLAACAFLCLTQAIRVMPSELTSDVAYDLLSAMDDAKSMLTQVKHPALLAEFYYDAAQEFMRGLANPPH